MHGHGLPTTCIVCALPRSTTILEASPRARMTWKHTNRSSHGRRGSELEFKFGHARAPHLARVTLVLCYDVLRLCEFRNAFKKCPFIFNRVRTRAIGGSLFVELLEFFIGLFLSNVNSLKNDEILPGEFEVD